MLADQSGPLEHDGVAHFPGAALEIVDELTRLAARLPSGKAGVRLFGIPGLAEALAPIGQLASRLQREPCIPVRAILFDKSDAANWSLGWHQDRTIAVKARRVLPGYETWSRKQGIDHVEPPFELIEKMLTLRVHLDPVGEDNAPLIVAPGSHRLGRIEEGRIGSVVGSCDLVACLAARGDVWAYRTAILHSSKAASPGLRRRVVQIDYASAALPAGLEWQGI